MFTEEIHLRDYLQVIIKWRWMIIAVFVVVVLAASIFSFRRIPVYKATARILIERTTPNIVSFADPAAGSSLYWDPQFMETQASIIKSRAVAERMLQKPEIKHAFKTQAPSPIPQEAPSTGFSLDDILSQIREFREFIGEQNPPELSELAQAAVAEEQIIQRFLGMIDITPVRQSRLVNVSVTSTHPEQATLIVNTLIDTYIAHNRETRSAASREAVSWLLEEVDIAGQKVSEAEAALQEYKEQHQIISVEGRQNLVMQKLSEFSTALNMARIRRMTLETQYRELQSFAVGELPSVPLISNDPVVQGLNVELLRLERQYLELLKTFREKHPNVVSAKSQITSVQNQLVGEIQRIVTSSQNDYEIALAQEERLVGALEEQKDEALELNEKTIMYDILREEVESNRKIYNTLLERMKETSVTERLETTNVQIVDRASIPNAPIGPNKKRSIMLAIVLGLGIGTTLAFFLEYWNDKISTPEELKKYLDMPILGLIPKVSVAHIAPNEEKEVKDVIIETIALVDPQSSIAETYRGLRTHVAFSDLQHDIISSEQGTTLLVTSAEPSEGKSCTVANLGIVMAQSERKTVIVDCDFRRPRMDGIFHLQETRFGLTDILTDRSIDNGIVNVIQHTDLQYLHIIPCGSTPSNPSELVSLEKIKTILTKLKSQYDTILIDSPPVNVVTDPIILSQMVDGVILVLHAGKTKRHVAQRARDELREAGANILGGVLNNVDLKKARYNYYHYSAYHYPKYYREDDKREKRMKG